MATVKEYRVGTDGEIVCVQAVFAAQEGVVQDDLNFRWKASWLLYRDASDGTPKMRWGVWDGRRVLWATSDLEVAMRLIDAILAKGAYRADTVMPDVIPTGSEDAAVLVFPPYQSETVTLDEESRESLGRQRTAIEEVLA